MALSTKALKILALFWDFIYIILGIGVIVVGAITVYKFDYFSTLAFIILSFGIAALLAAIFGTLGAARESSRLSKTFVGILVILILLQILAVAYVWIFKTSLLILFDGAFSRLWQEQPVPIKPGNTSTIASIEKWFECCGNKGPKDYLLPPYSCYNSNEKLNLEGCRQKFIDYFNYSLSGLSIYTIVLVAVELICAILAYVLANSIINRWRRSKYYAK